MQETRYISVQCANWRSHVADSTLISQVHHEVSDIICPHLRGPMRQHIFNVDFQVCLTAFKIIPRFILPYPLCFAERTGVAITF
jgi:hypothetical protein